MASTSESAISRRDLLGLIESFIDKIQDTRKIMLGVSISALVLAPLAIGLSVYLITHPAFFIILEENDEFGVFLGILLGAILVISGIWLVTGIRQYISINSWNRRYQDYVKKRDAIDDIIATEYHLNED